MAAFPMPAADARAVVSFLRSISGTVDEQVAGDPEEGRRIFLRALQPMPHVRRLGRHPRGRFDRDREAHERRRFAPRRSIQDPDAHMSAGFETVEVKTKSGATILGAARHEEAPFPSSSSIATRNSTFS